MNIRWLIQLFVYCVGSLFHNETFFCSHAGCNRQFQSRSGRDSHIRISHRAREKEYCRHGCGKSYPKGSSSLRYHHQTCDNNEMIGYGINQQFYRPTETHVGNGFYLKETAHNGNYKLFRYAVHESLNIQEKLQQIVTHDVRDIIQRVKKI